ncbi:MAG TPA: RNA methyltransferase [bacterium]|nr:RNA methyltransferase [bacterium]HPN32088.1 RNA methyltransferase [bacterium]
MGLPIKIEKEILKLHNKKNRKELYKYIVEGIICVNELLNAGIEPEYIVHTENFAENPKGKELLKRIKKINAPVYSVDENVFRKLVDTVSPQGIFCIAPMRFQPIEQALDNPKSKIILLDKISDPGNLGTIIRTAAALNMSGIMILSNSVELYNMKVIRSALGSHLHIPIMNDIEPEFVIETLLQKKFKIFAAMPSGGENFKTALNNADKTAVVIGNEHHGVDKLFYENANISSVHIPINQKIESLNAAVTAAIIMSQLSYK